MTKHPSLRMFILALVLAIPRPVYAQTAVVIATPERYRYVRDLTAEEVGYSGGDTSEIIVKGGIYRVDFRILRVISGSMEKKKFTTQIPVLSGRYVAKGKRLALLISNEGRETKTLHWKTVATMMCFFTDGFGTHIKEEDFSEFVRGEDERCIEAD
jgi:hypothetical protein